MSPEKRLQMIRDIKLDLNKNVFEKQEFVIPNPKGGEDEQTYIGRCISAIVDEYDQEGQAYAVCKSTWDSK
jgi:hypothetical protein